MSSDTVVVKVEPSDSYDHEQSVNLSSAVLQNGSREGSSVSPGKDNEMPLNDTRNFTCLLCDVVCRSREDLRKHLKLLHASKTFSAMNNAGYFGTISPESSTRVFSGYVNYRYTCATCGAKFKSFRMYLTHNMSHRSENGIQHLDEMRMAALFGPGKQYMQDYMEADDSLTGTFTCSECDTVFVQRDAYAMHMMMRAMNESCKSSSMSFDEDPRIIDREVTRQENTSEVKENGIHSQSDGEQQRCIEDVTTKVDQDEYLKCVLDKVCVNDAPHGDIPDYHIEDRKACIFCKETFIDQDSLAMHVMSDHAEEMTSTSTNARNNIRNTNNTDYMTWITMATRPTAMPYLCKYCNETFMSRDSLALHVLTHAHLEDRLSEQARSTYKRKYDVVADPASAFIDTKKARYLSQVISGDVSASTMASTSKTIVNLYCEECDIRFYAESEYDWHMRRHVEGGMPSYAEPLCLTKEKPSENDETSKTEDIVESIETKVIKPRRNSFSCDISVDTQHINTLPRRPVSVGVCSMEHFKHLNKSGVDMKGDELRNNGKTVTKNELLQTINALSSSEQRIIYSVFGKDLSLKVSKPEVAQDMRITVSPKHGKKLDNLDGYVPQSNAKSDGLKTHDLKSASSVTSDMYKNGDLEERHRLLALEKEAPMCKYCEILFFNKAIYYLHMGLHNVNNPWQCNVCGKLCSNAVDFSAHVIHM